MSSNIKRVTNAYYGVTWNMKQREIVFALCALLIFWLFGTIVIKMRMANAVGIVLFICQITTVIEIVMAYLAFKVPCVRWHRQKRRERKPDEPFKDITHEQNQYKTSIMWIYYSVLFLALIGIIVFGFFIVMYE